MVGERYRPGLFLRPDRQTVGADRAVTTAPAHGTDGRTAGEVSAPPHRGSDPAPGPAAGGAIRPTTSRPGETGYGYVTRWHADGTVEKIHGPHRRRPPGRAHRGPGGSQSVRPLTPSRGTPAASPRARRPPAARGVSPADVLGLLPAVHVVAAGFRDRDGVKRPPPWTRPDHPAVERSWADQGFAGRLVTWAEDILERTVEIAHTPSGRCGFRGQPTRGEGGAHLRLAHRAPPPDLRLRERTGTLRDHDPLGDDRRHDGMGTHTGAVGESGVAKATQDLIHAPSPGPTNDQNLWIGEVIA